MKNVDQLLREAGSELAHICRMQVYITDRSYREDQNPLAELRYLWDRYAPQMDDYISRAINPSSAPAYGVPGEGQR